MESTEYYSKRDSSKGSKPVTADADGTEWRVGEPYGRYTVDRSVLKWDIQSSFYLMVFHSLLCRSIATETERQRRSHWTCLDSIKASWRMNSHAGEPMRDIVDANIAVIPHLSFSLRRVDLASFLHWIGELKWCKPFFLRWQRLKWIKWILPNAEMRLISRFHWFQ